MRIISQDKKRDVPYDSVMVYVSDVLPKQIWVNFVQYKETYVMGKYNSEEDALYVMKSIRQAVNNEYRYYVMPSAEKVEGCK